VGEAVGTAVVGVGVGAADGLAVATPSWTAVMLARRIEAMEARVAGLVSAELLEARAYLTSVCEKFPSVKAAEIVDVRLAMRLPMLDCGISGCE
jgi:hypothetical protein